jgi:hypothetical protein
MKMMLGFVTGAVVLVLACSVSNTENTTSSGGSNDNSTSSGGTSSGGASGNNGSSGATGSSGQSSAFKDCNQQQSAGTCTEAELRPYTECVSRNCESGFVECYGPDYKNGKFSGPCSEYLGCVQRCDCNDSACITECVKKMDQACQNCVLKIGNCQQGCSLPECANPQGNVDGGTKTCDDLKACCDKIADKQLKDVCNNLHQNASGNNTVCNAYYSGYKMYCP